MLEVNKFKQTSFKLPNFKPSHKMTLKDTLATPRSMTEAAIREKVVEHSISPLEKLNFGKLINLVEVEVGENGWNANIHYDGKGVIVISGCKDEHSAERAILGFVNRNRVVPMALIDREREMEFVARKGYAEEPNVLVISK